MPLLAYDCTLKKVGCVLLQAVLGGDGRLAMELGSENWLFAQTADLKVYRLSQEDAEDLVAFHHARAVSKAENVRRRVRLGVQAVSADSRHGCAGRDWQENQDRLGARPTAGREKGNTR